MNDLGEIIGAIVLICLLVAGGVFLISLPFAFFGWILLAFINIFGAGIIYGYWTCVIAGLGMSVISGFIGAVNRA